MEADVHNNSVDATGYLVDNNDLTGFTAVWSIGVTGGTPILGTDGRVELISKITKKQGGILLQGGCCLAFTNHLHFKEKSSCFPSVYIDWK
ncbi:MAG: hypothetical protein JRI62_10480 [Deltaproteobacteria bacterium]|nr:hypothetical protein [Deltaproteobacteria bacterium]